VYSYNSNDQLTDESRPDSNVFYAYDENGSLIHEANDTETLRTYSYNLQNRLASATVGGATVDYTYNPDGIRVRAKVGQNNINYVIDPFNETGYAQVFKEIRPDANMVYVYGHDALAQAKGVSDPNYFIYDGHGSVRHLADSAGGITDTFNYDAYGNAHGFSPANAATALLYCGEQYDSHLSQYYLRARYYDPANGRFNQMDDFDGSNSDPQSLHKYLYASCDPIMQSDPSGLFSYLQVFTTTVTIASLISQILPNVYHGLSAAHQLVELAGFSNDVRELANRGVIDLIVAEQIRYQAFQTANELVQTIVKSAMNVARQVLTHFAYSMLFSAVTSVAMGGIEAGVTLTRSARVAAKVGDDIVLETHHLIFQCAVKQGTKQETVWRLPKYLHRLKGTGLHSRLWQHPKFNRLLPRRNMPMSEVLNSVGRQTWLNELGDAYKWLETEFGNDYKGIYKAFEKAAKQVGGVGGLR